MCQSGVGHKAVNRQNSLPAEGLLSDGEDRQNKINKIIVNEMVISAKQKNKAEKEVKRQCVCVSVCV